MKHKKVNNYLAAFVTLIDYSVKLCAELKVCCLSYDISRLQDIRVLMHTIEHQADQEKNKLIHQLVKEFLPPMDREDLITIYRSIDDVSDALEEVILKLNVYQMPELSSSCEPFMRKIEQEIDATRRLLLEFGDFKHSKELAGIANEIAHLEEDCDVLYEHALQKLYREEKDAKKIMMWQDIYSQLEVCADSCRKVMRDVQMAYLKNI